MLQKPNQLETLFHRILSLNLDDTLPARARLTLLLFVTTAFQSLENAVIRKRCAPLVSVSTWHNLHSDAAREEALSSNSGAKKAWRAATKRYNAADDTTKAQIRFDRQWLYVYLLGFLKRLSAASYASDDISYCGRVMELLIDLASQLPTRRYTVTLFKDLNILALLKLSPLTQSHSIFASQVELFGHVLDFPVDDSTGRSLPADTRNDLHYQKLSRLQRFALKHFEKKLKLLALSTAASITDRSELESHLKPLSRDDLERLCSLLHLRTDYPQQAKISVTSTLLLETLLAALSPAFDVHSDLSHAAIMPTEQSLYDELLSQAESYDDAYPLPVPKLNLQYLELNDFLWRSFHLYRLEAFFEIKGDLEYIVQRMKARASPEGNPQQFAGFSKFALQINKPAIVEVGQPLVGSERAAFVRAEILLDRSRLSDRLRLEWDSLRPSDVVFLLCVNTSSVSESSIYSSGTAASPASAIKHVRTAEVAQLLDGDGRPLREPHHDQINGFTERPSQRRLLINLDPVAFKADQDRLGSGMPDVYSTLNVLVRRNRRENNFKPILDTLQSLAVASAHLPLWLRDSFLGYGDPRLSSYRNLPNRIQTLDYRDTFLGWQHLKESFPGRVRPTTGLGQDLAPPYVLGLFKDDGLDEAGNVRKRRRAEMEDERACEDVVEVSSYKPPNTGPYPVDTPRTNTIKFTPLQIQAITSGTQPGLTIVVGPPGTGKTDTVTQTINLLYHNFPRERILLVAHSNQALNQLFQKIIALDIDSRHLLRLGHGEEELEADTSYSKYGRVESFLENRALYLAEVERLAASLGVEGAHGSSCETADYFNQVYVQPGWSRFWVRAHSPDASSQSIIEDFPFHSYFSNAPKQPLLSPSWSVEENLTVAAGCEHHIKHIFSELESIRPFEILRAPKEQANYLLMREARIIAMTSTHAAMRRAEIANLGFRYDTVIMEEAAQVTEMETFIPFAMQHPDPVSGELPLKRVVLVGDHLQNSPIIQNQAFRQYANLEQSLFLRLIRLGVPTITLDQQGRCRPSLMALFQWRYPALSSLPHLQQQIEFQRANAGFRYDYQFIDVPEYQGQGEREPTPHFIQNLGEAEYAVALYQYMRLLGYPARSISILATYAGQKALIRDVLEHRCKGNPMFGQPRTVTTVDKYQGEQNDYIILSMTRTKSIGYLRDVRRLTVALSRARLGLYILGRRDLFASSCLELKPALRLFNRRPDKLVLITGEMYPTERPLLEDSLEPSSNRGDEISHSQPNEAEMDGVEHLGQYVYEMTQAKIKASGGTIVNNHGPSMTNGHASGGVADADTDVIKGDNEDVDEDDPLHEQTDVL